MAAQSWAAGTCPRARVSFMSGHRVTLPCRDRSCPSCGVLWLGDTRVKVLAAAQQLAGAVALVSVTAPGQDVLPWAPCGTVVDPDEAKRWNDYAPERWSELHREAARRARARARDLGIEWRLLVKVWEYQKRGVLHLHLLIPCGTSAEREASETYVAVLAQRGRAHGFGFVDRGKLPESGGRRSARRLEPVSPKRAASYVASYVASSGAGKEGIAEVARKQGVPGAIVYCAVTLTRRSGVTMRSLRDRRRIATRYPDAVACPDRWRAACVADAQRRSRAPLTAAAGDTIYRAALDHSWGGVIDLATGELRLPTAAAPPPAVSEAVSAPRGPLRMGGLRLDHVPHDGHAVGDHRPTSAVVTEVVNEIVRR